jgi:hypothetical protein
VALHCGVQVVRLLQQRSPLVNHFLREQGSTRRMFLNDADMKVGVRWLLVLVLCMRACGCFPSRATAV